jgi:hypothetical protein
MIWVRNWDMLIRLVQELGSCFNRLFMGDEESPLYLVMFCSKLANLDTARLRVDPIIHLMLECF